MNQRGFTFIELIVALGIFAGIVLITIPSISKLGNSHSSGPANVLSSLMISTTRHARSGDNASAWGVYLPYDDVTRTTNEVILFSGDSYATRDTTQDLSYAFDDQALFTTVELSGSAPSGGSDHETVFSALTGETNLYGTISITFRNQTTTINISPSGFIIIP